MSRLFVFTSRLVVLAIITAVGFAVIPTEDMLVDRSLRLSISALQVLVLSGLYCANVVLSAILRVIQHSSPSRFSRLEDKRQTDADSTTSESAAMAAMATTARVPLTARAPAGPPTPPVTVDEPTAPEPEETDADKERDVEVDVYSLDDSLDTCVPDTTVSFETQACLDWYVLRVHVVGLALWQTFLTFDCTSRDIDICFITGLVTGWFCEKARHMSCSHLLLVWAYAGVVITLVLSEQHVFVSAIPASDYLTSEGRLQFYFNICIMPFATGAFWVFAAHSQSREIMHDARRSVVTFLLISLTYPLYWTRIDLAMVQAFLVKLPHISILFILVLSPVFKCISIYILLLSLQRRHTLDLIIALVTVLCLSSAVLYDLDTVGIIRTALTGLLLVCHVVMLNCTSCKHLALR